MKDARLAAYLESRIAEELEPGEALGGAGAPVRGVVDWALDLVSQRAPEELLVRVANRSDDAGVRTVVELLIADQPFVVDTFRLNLRLLELRERLFVHRLLAIERDEDGSVARLGPDVRDVREVYLYAELPPIEDSARRDAIAEELRGVFENLRWVVADHGRMLTRIRQHTADLSFAGKSGSQEIPAPEHLQHFLSWLGDDNYVFFGYRWYDTRRRDGAWEVRTDPGSGLGLMRHTSGSRFLEERDGYAIPALVRARLDDPRLVFFDKSRTASRFHREGRLDCLSVKVLGEDGELRGFGRFIGMLRHRATRTRGSDLPILSARRDRLLAELGAERGSHVYKAAIEAFDSLPLEFLFPYDREDVSRVVQQVLRAGESGGVEIAVVPDPLNRSFFVSVILSRAHYTEQLRQGLLDLLVERYQANYVDHRSSFVDDQTALIHFFCTSADDVDLEVLSDLECEVRELATPWEERFESALLERHREQDARRLAAEYGRAFPEEYRSATRVPDACEDLARLELLRCGASPVELRGAQDGAQLKIYLPARPYLTDLLPMLDNCGLRVFDATLTELPGLAAAPLWIATCRMAEPEAGADPLALDGLRAVLEGRMEDGRMNRLIRGARITWREVDLLRAYFSWAQQLGIAPQLRRAAGVLLRYPDATRALLDCFRTRFDPDLHGERAPAEREAHEALDRERAEIRTADEDRVLALIRDLIGVTVRTNFYASGPDGDHVIVLKTVPRELPQAPSPRPWAEIFVHAADLSGVHLRGGPIARGGIRWSDRLGDFRTEVLGLVKTQMVKNGLIVPVGAKGGFVLKRRPAAPEDARAEADRQYARFIGCLLALSDDLVDGAVVAPERVVRHDGDDPYLVVAADKGTAHLSDTANRVAEARGYWLGDAFASGGSEGYDHKELGITARGAWVCMRRHFRELGIDVECEPFTVCGIGDMSGDVFGNGLLLARQGRLLAAFDHEHVFIDPDPEATAAWQERKRLFELPGSRWSDYAAAKISAGGGVFSRDARELRLSPQAQRVLGVEAAVLSGEELVRAVLRMPVDLLWNGGVGTYVKASSEAHAEVGDRANDGVRVDARELRAKVVAEGGNLGLTQRARVEFALLGGRVQTDAIDNSGGVDLSDREVNCKVLLAARSADGRLDRAERNRLLRSCADQVAAAVLCDNEAQSRCLSLDALRAAEDSRRIDLAVEFLERQAGLDPALEGFPDSDALRTRLNQQGTGYTRPELAVLLGYTKLLAKRELAQSMHLQHPSFRSVLPGYFPEALRERFAAEIDTHPLRREIAATQLANLVIDQAGVTLVPELCGALAVGVADVVAAYHTMDGLLDARALRLALEVALAPEAARLAAALRVEAAVREAARGLLGLERRAVLEPDELARRAERVEGLREVVHVELDPDEAEACERRVAELAGAGLDEALARRVERLSGVVRSLGVLSLAADAQASLPQAVELYVRVGKATRIAWLCDRLARPDRRDRWERVVAENLQLEVLEVQRALTGQLLARAHGAPPLEVFRREQGAALARIDELARRVEAEAPRGLAPLAVVAHHIRRLNS